MSDTGYRCPRCGNEEEFFADLVVLSGRTRITADGCDYFDYPNDVELADGAAIECGKCGHAGAPSSFEE